MAGLRVGDPSDPGTQLGPLVVQRQQQRVRDYIRDRRTARARGWSIGGTDMPDGHRPRLVRPAHPVRRRRQHHAHRPRGDLRSGASPSSRTATTTTRSRIANDSDYGLAGSVWTADTTARLAIAARIRTGTLGINQGYTMDPFAPFGGVKASGYGRELGREGLDRYLDTKSIAIAPGG